MGIRRELVKFIDIYGHDFLNHLQVISGMAQLNNPERIRGYVLEVTGQIREINRITKVENATVAALLLIFRRRAGHYGVPVLITVKSPLTECAVSEERLEAVLEPAFSRLAEVILPALEGSGETVELELAETEDGYTIGFQFPVEPGESINGLNETVAGIDGAMRKIGGGSAFEVRGGDARLVITLPR